MPVVFPLLCLWVGFESVAGAKDPSRTNNPSPHSGA